jgi:poly(3-hydroxybutyrate) depolymerase
MPVIGYHGVQDGLVAYEDGHDAIEQWVAMNGCTDTTVREDYGDSYCFIYETCDEGVETGLCTLDPMGHCWPGGSSSLCLPGIGPYNDDIPANQHMWNFMSRFTLP